MKVTTYFSGKPPVEAGDVDHVSLEIDGRTFEIRRTAIGLFALQTVWPIVGMLAITPGGSNLIHVDVVTGFKKGKRT